MVTFDRVGNYRELCFNSSNYFWTRSGAILGTCAFAYDVLILTHSIDQNLYNNCYWQGINRIIRNYNSSISRGHINGLKYKTAVTPLLMFLSYCSLALSHRHADIACSLTPKLVTSSGTQNTGLGVFGHEKWGTGNNCSCWVHMVICTLGYHNGDGGRGWRWGVHSQILEWDLTHFA